MRVQKSIEIAAPPEKIWPFLVEPAKVLQWSITFRKFDYADGGPVGVGTNIYIEEKAGGPLMKMNFQITEWVKDRLVAMKMISGPMMKSYQQRWTIEPSHTGATFTLAEEIEFPLGPIGRLMGRMLEGSSRAFVDRMLPELKRIAEA